MGCFSRPLLLVIFAALAIAGCAQKAPFVAIEIRGPVCSDCPTTLRVGSDGTITDSTDPNHSVTYRGSQTDRELFARFPYEEFEYAQAHSFDTSGDTMLPIALVESDGRSQLAYVPWGSQGVPYQIEHLHGWLNAFLNLTSRPPRDLDVINSLRRGTLRSVRLEMLGCYGSCPNYDVRFRRDGSAAIHFVRPCPGTPANASAHVDFDRVIAPAYEMQQLRSYYAMRSVDTLGARITITTPHASYASWGPDSMTWGRNFSSLVARWDQLARDTAWNPAVVIDCPLRRR